MNIDKLTVILDRRGMVRASATYSPADIILQTGMMPVPLPMPSGGPNGRIELTGDDMVIESLDGKVIISGKQISNIEIEGDVNIGMVKK